VQNNLPSVVHINVRLSEGGAATIARDLHGQLLKQGWRSQLAYGYGKSGGKSPLQNSIQNAFPIAGKTTAAVNYGMHSFFGIDVRMEGRGKKLLEKALDEADIIHLHAIHSYFLTYRWLLKKLIRLKKPVVWTMHDMWVLTGRCAYYSDCRKWVENCGRCPDLKNYPSSIVDFSRREALEKKRLLEELAPFLTHIPVSEFFSDNLKQKYPHHNMVRIPNSISSGLEEIIRNRDVFENSRDFNALIIGADLSDEKKQNIAFLNKVIGENRDVNFYAVGTKSPFHQENVSNLGPIFDREKLVDVYMKTDVLVFTSVIDNYPSVVIESLCAGTPVLALHSLGANEILSAVNLKTHSKEEIGEILKQKLAVSPQQRAALREQALKVFSASRMFENYFNLYKSILKQSYEH
jgi:putative colanic acid biosynthesis glycosyltransferase